MADQPVSDPSSPRFPGAGASLWLIGALVAIAIGVIVVLAVVVDGDDQVLVVVPQGVQADVDEDDAVRVTGTVGEIEEIFDVGEDEFGDEEDFDDFGEENAILAESVEQVDEGESQDGVTVDDIADEDEFEGGDEPVTVVGEVEDDSVGLQSFTIGEPDD